MLIIDPASQVPPYEQLRRQVVEQIATGELAVGSRLPAVRRLAGDLGLAPNTVARAYRELESQGYVRTAGRNGTLVADQTADGEVAQRALELTVDYVRSMAGLGLGGDDIVRYVHRGISAR